LTTIPTKSKMTAYYCNEQHVHENCKATAHYEWVKHLDPTLNFCADCCNVRSSDQNSFICKCGRKLYYCCECIRYQPESIMQKSDCTLCGGRKCFKHGGDIHTCIICKSEGLCADCVGYRQCCEGKR
jgi:hypothetical protein